MRAFGSNCRRLANSPASGGLGYKPSFILTISWCGPVIVRRWRGGFCWITVQSPALYPGPIAPNAPIAIKDVIAIVLCGGRACVVWQNPHARPERKVRCRRPSAWPLRNDSMFLIGVGKNQLPKQLAPFIANEAVTLINRLASRASILRHGHPP